MRAAGLTLLEAMTSEDFATAYRMEAWTALVDLRTGYPNDALSAAEVAVGDEGSEPAARRRACELLLRDSAER